MSQELERRFFKLPTGYVHVDEIGIAFTRSGNWQEAATAKERTGRAGLGRMVRVVLGIALIITGMAFFALKGLRGDGAMGFVIGAAAAAFGAHKLINKIQDDFAQTFRIPFAKVRSVGGTDGTLTIAFINGKWKEDEVKFELGDADAEWVKAVWKSRRQP